MVLLDRTRRAGPYLEWKVRIFVVAAVSGLAGIYLNERWLTGAAIVMLFAGLALRYVPIAESSSDEEEAGDAD